MEFSLFCDVTQRMLVLIYRRAWPLKMGPIGCPETSVNIHQQMLRNITEERRSHVSGIFKSRTLWLSLRLRAVWCETARPSSFSGRGEGCFASRVTELAASCSLQPCSFTTETAMTVMQIWKKLCYHFAEWFLSCSIVACLCLLLKTEIGTAYWV